ncbi:MAG: M48 family metalloprotease [Cyanobacteria bacterium SZAS TMP-1]|nr:M48 family metalloprotease [Cyanobacteria bacterium SZAS TMP-1]
MTAETVARRRFPRMSSNAFEHPADRAALDALRKIPVLDKVVHKFVEFGWERYMRIQLLGQAVHVGPKQCKNVYKLVREAADILDIHEPDVFLTNNPVVNAYTFGVDRPFIVLHSSLVDLFTEEELLGIIGHEMGHIKAGHVLYRTLAFLLIRITDAFMPIRGVAGLALQVALFDWYRKSELTADRAELLVTQNVTCAIHTHMKLACGSKKLAEEIDPQEFLRQADSYEELDYTTLNKIYKLLFEVFLSHPLSVYRAKEIKQWSESKQYKEIMAGRYPTKEQDSALRACPHCGSQIAPSFFFCPDCGKNARI